MLLKPAHLQPGDTIGLLSPSSGMANMVPHRTKRAIDMLTEMGFIVKVAPNALKNRGYISASAQERADDLHTLFEQTDVKAIISFIGGNHSNQMLKYINFDIIKKNPKIFIGYSDITVLHFALFTQANLVTFYGPAALTQFAENPQIFPFTKEYFKKAVVSTEPIGNVREAEEWTDEILDWFEMEDLKRPRVLKKNRGYQWLREGKAQGHLIGGCITSMLHLRGTKYWPHFKESLLFWEVPEGDADFTKGESPAAIDAYLADFENSGIFQDISGMIIGRPFGYTEKQVTELKQIILEATESYKFPILFNADIGHTDPMITIPLGIKAQIDSSKNSFEILESGVQ